MKNIINFVAKFDNLFCQGKGKYNKREPKQSDCIPSTITKYNDTKDKLHHVKGICNKDNIYNKLYKRDMIYT